MSPSEPGPFTLGGEVLDPGARRRVELPVGRFVTGEWLRLGVEVIHGTAPGPALWLSGAIHGDELDGVEIIREVLAGLDPSTLAGTVVAAPVVNVFGFVAESRYLPDRRDLNRAFPGSPDGSMAARLADLFMREVVHRCEYGVDFHCGSDDRQNLPQIRADLDDSRTRRLAQAFGTPLVLHNRPPRGSLRAEAGKAGARVLVYEAGEAGRFTDEAVAAGAAGTLRVLKSLGMVSTAPRRKGAPREVRSTHWVRAPRSGIIRIDTPLGTHVRKGAVLGNVFETLGDEAVRIRAGTAGVVIGRRVNPLVHQGEAVVHLAKVPAPTGRG